MKSTEEIQLGLVDISNDEYHAGPGISKSHLDVIAKQSPLHYWWKYLNPERVRDEPTPAMKLGSAIHAAIIEPELFEERYVESPKFDRRTKEGRALFQAFQEENEGKEVLTAEDYARCLAIRDAVYAHPVASGLLKGGKAEQSFFAKDPETDELIKCRFDYLLDSGEMAIDIKSTIDASPVEFARSVANYRYDIQPAWYFDILDILYGEAPKHWVYIAVEKDEPYAIGIYYATPEMIEIGRQTARRDFLKIVECKRKNEWPDYGAEIEPLEMPAWARRYRDDG